MKRKEGPWPSMCLLLSVCLLLWVCCYYPCVYYYLCLCYYLCLLLHCLVIHIVCYYLCLLLPVSVTICVPVTTCISLTLCVCNYMFVCSFVGSSAFDEEDRGTSTIYECGVSSVSTLSPTPPGAEYAVIYEAVDRAGNRAEPQVRSNQ
jgi:ferredoxin